MAGPGYPFPQSTLFPSLFQLSKLTRLAVSRPFKARAFRQLIYTGVYRGKQMTQTDCLLIGHNSFELLIKFANIIKCSVRQGSIWVLYFS